MQLIIENAIIGHRTTRAGKPYTQVGYIGGTLYIAHCPDIAEGHYKRITLSADARRWKVQTAQGVFDRTAIQPGHIIGGEQWEIEV